MHHSNFSNFDNLSNDTTWNRLYKSTQKIGDVDDIDGILIAVFIVAVFILAIAFSPMMLPTLQGILK